MEAQSTSPPWSTLIFECREIARKFFQLARWYLWIVTGWVEIASLRAQSLKNMKPLLPTDLLRQQTQTCIERQGTGGYAREPEPHSSTNVVEHSDAAWTWHSLTLIKCEIFASVFMVFRYTDFTILA